MLRKLVCIATIILVLLSCSKENDSTETKDPDNKTSTNIDPDGNEYTPIIIGTQVWMSENLKTTKFNDGTDIPKFKTDITELRNETEPAYTIYPPSDIPNLTTEAEVLETYGALYNWQAVNTGKLCPNGWHVPSKLEWDVLAEYLGGAAIAGAKIKEEGTEHWARNNETTTNEYGFDGRAAGSFGDFASEINAMAYWWTTTERDSTTAYYKQLHNYKDWLMQDFSTKRRGCSVRCIKD